MAEPLIILKELGKITALNMRIKKELKLLANYGDLYYKENMKLLNKAKS